MRSVLILQGDDDGNYERLWFLDKHIWEVRCPAFISWKGRRTRLLCFRIIHTWCQKRRGSDSLCIRYAQEQNILTYMLLSSSLYHFQTEDNAPFQAGCTIWMTTLHNNQYKAGCRIPAWQWRLSSHIIATLYFHCCIVAYFPKKPKYSCQ